MAFSQIGITDVRVVADGPDLFVAWSASSPAGTTFQVYVDRRLAWYGRSQRCHVPMPIGGIGRNVWVELGTVGSFEPTVDYSSSLVAPGGRSERANLSWSGGTYLDSTGQDDIQGFLIYQSPNPGAMVNMTAPVDTVVAYPGGWINDGFGKGGYGGGGFGRSATLYEWQSGPLVSGVWLFAVVPFDKAGNCQGTSPSVPVTINAAPRPPAMDASGARLIFLLLGTVEFSTHAQLAIQPYGVKSVATTYTANVGLQKPATSDRNWDVPINANADALDGMTAIGGLATTTTETPSATLQVGIKPGNFIKSNGTVVSFAGTSIYVVPASATTYLWLSDAGVPTSGLSFPTTIHLRLALVVSGPNSILQVVDERIQCAVAGTGLGFVLKSGDSMSGPLTIASPVTGIPLLVADSVNGLIGFFGATPALQVTSLTALASGSSGVASNTVVDVGTTFSQTLLNNNFASVAAKVDALIAALKHHGLMGS